MSDSQPSRVVLFDNDDPEMQRAYERARATFKFFWREMTWERRRIVPGLGLACVKAPFTDGPGRRKAGTPRTEQMWIGEVEFDGRDVTGVLLNKPSWLKSVNAGDGARFALGEISDWMYSIDDVVYGAHTVNLLRSRMGRQEREEHDGAWGLDFGDPARERLFPTGPGWFDARTGIVQEHPMSENMTASFAEQLTANPGWVAEADERGWTYLHQMALGGNLSPVRVLLDHGADVNAVTGHGMTALQLARSLGWDKVAELLVSRGAR